MSWQRVSLHDAHPVPWRNGGGVTRELLAWPASADWAVRMSVADIERDGPFSAFPGINRWFAVLEGDGVRLRFPAQEHVLIPGSAPLRFDGGAAPDCTLIGGATRDFNLMLRGGHAVMGRIQGTRAVAGEPGRMVALYVHAGNATLAGEAIPAGTLAWRILESKRRFEIACEDALWMEISL